MNHLAESLYAIGPVLLFVGALAAGVVAMVRGLGAEPPAELNAWPDELWRQL